MSGAGLCYTVIQVTGGIMLKKCIAFVLLILFFNLHAFAEESFKEGGKEIGSGFKKIGKATGKTTKKSGKAVGKAFKKSGKETGKAFKQMGKEVGGAFEGK